MTHAPRPWYQTSYERMLVDMHITDHDPSFLQRYDPAAYADAMQRAGVDCAMVYAVNHAGFSFFPSRTGRMHPNLHGRDIFRETVAELRKRNITPVAIWTSIVATFPTCEQPAWRVAFPDGTQQPHGRTWLACPNSPGYRDYSARELAELAAHDIDGIFIDMTFWPTICVCHTCRQRWRDEAGAEIPATIHLGDPAWMAFQNRRMDWMAEYARFVTDAVHRVRPGLTVVHQGSTITFNSVKVGMDRRTLHDHSEYATGDFHMGPLHQLASAKILGALTRSWPFELMTPVNERLNDHQCLKSVETLCCEAANTLASGGAPFRIHDINPDGTLDAFVYDTLAEVSARMRPFTEAARRHQPRPFALTGVYFEDRARVDLKENGAPVFRTTGDTSNFRFQSRYADEVSGAIRVLARHHIPCRVVAPGQLAASGVNTLLLTSCPCLRPEEARAIREFVRQGGLLVATGPVGLHDLDGATFPDSQLADVLGVRWTGRATPDNHAIHERDTGYTLSHYNAVTWSSEHAWFVEATTARALAHVAVPRFPQTKPETRWASHHCSPSTEVTDHPAVAFNRFGAGACLYIASHLLALPGHAHQSYAAKLLRAHLPRGNGIETDAPRCVEITWLRSTREPAWLLNFVNYSAEQPPVPVGAIRVRAALPHGFTPTRARLVSSNTPLPLHTADGWLELTVPRLDILEMVELHTT